MLPACLRLLAWPRSRAWLALPLAYVAALTLLSALPDPAVAVPSSAAMAELAASAFTLPPQARNFLHLPLYCGLGALFAWALSAWSLRPWRSHAWALALSAGYAAGNEWLQGFTPGRRVDGLDLGANLAGVVLGWAGVVLLQRWATRRLTPKLRGPGWISGLRRVGTGEPARWGTRVRVDWDEAELKLRFECEDEHAWGTYIKRDDPLWKEEVVELFIAPDGDDPWWYYEFEVSPLGTFFDARVRNPTGRRRELVADTGWDCPGARWRVGGGEARQDWWAELVLPWRALAPEGPLPEVFRLNLFRVERPRGGEPEFSAWSPTFTNPPDFHQPRSFGWLVRETGAIARHEALKRLATLKRPCGTKTHPPRPRQGRFPPASGFSHS